jgi:hypothetical protein
MALPNNSNFSVNISQLENEFLFVQMSPGFINTMLLSAGLYQMYSGIEIAHPVYAVLFCNLLITLLSSMIDVFIFLFITLLSYSVLVNGSCITCFLFHCCSWCILSCLRYLYIVHSKWLHDKLPNSRTVCVIAIFSIFCIFFLTSGAVLGIVTSFGWPYKRAADMSATQRMINAGAILTTYFSLVGASCFFYISVLRKKGKLGINSVGILEEDLENETLEACSDDRLANNNIVRSRTFCKQSDNKSITTLSQVLGRDPIYYRNKLTTENVTHKIKIKKRCLSCSDIINFELENNAKKTNSSRRTNSNDELNSNTIIEWNTRRTNIKSQEDSSNLGKSMLYLVNYSGSRLM